MERLYISEMVMLFLLALSTLLIARKFANKIGLVDKPNVRKKHQGEIPLVGGVSLGITLIAFTLFNLGEYPKGEVFAIAAAVLLTVGVIDDKYDLSAKLRMGIQVLLALLMVYLGHLELLYLGDLFGHGGITLQSFPAVVVTVLAVIGAINAFNMIDGIDGLLGCMTITTFLSLAAALWMAQDYELVYVCFVIIVAIIPFLFYNLGGAGSKYKIFMGDSGSMVIGFAVVWLLLSSTQDVSVTEHELQPMTVIWFIFVPLIDMASIMWRRIRQGKSPFEADRGHLHHIILDNGFSSGQTLAFISIFAIICSSVGLSLQLLKCPDSINFLSFIACSALYHVSISRVSLQPRNIDA